MRHLHNAQTQNISGGLVEFFKKEQDLYVKQIKGMLFDYTDPQMKEE